MDVVQEVNEILAHAAEVTFIAFGWEMLSPGVGRPQDEINQDVRDSDFMMVVLWDRWGSRPGPASPYSSGTEEEFSVAMECLDDPDLPMKDIVVLFKSADERQLADPGSELQKVLAFRRDLEKGARLMHKPFDTLEEFKDTIRGRLVRWLRDPKTKRTLPDDATVPVISHTSVVSSEDPLEAARLFAENGRIADAEREYARATVSATDLRALSEYARFLRRLGRLSRAEVISERLLVLAGDLEDDAASIDARSHLGIVKRKQGQLRQSARYLREALALARDTSVPGRIAYLLDNLALTLRTAGDWDQALELLREAERMRVELDDPGALASSRINIGYLTALRGEPDVALKMHEDALSLAGDHPRTRATAWANIGIDQEMLGDRNRADEAYLKSLELNRENHSADGEAMNLFQLAGLRCVDDPQEAETLALQCLEINDRTGNREGIGNAFHVLGRARRGAGDLHGAERDLRLALESFNGISYQLGVAGASLDLAGVRLERVGSDDPSVSLLTETAYQIALRLGHVDLIGRIEARR